MNKNPRKILERIYKKHPYVKRLINIKLLNIHMHYDNKWINLYPKGYFKLLNNIVENVENVENINRNCENTYDNAYLSDSIISRSSVKTLSEDDNLISRRNIFIKRKSKSKKNNQIIYQNLYYKIKFNKKITLEDIPKIKQIIKYLLYKIYNYIEKIEYYLHIKRISIFIDWNDILFLIQQKIVILFNIYLFLLTSILGNIHYDIIINIKSKLISRNIMNKLLGCKTKKDTYSKILDEIFYKSIHIIDLSRTRVLSLSKVHTNKYTNKYIDILASKISLPYKKYYKSKWNVHHFAYFYYIRCCVIHILEELITYSGDYNDKLQISHLCVKLQKYIENYNV